MNNYTIREGHRNRQPRIAEATIVGAGIGAGLWASGAVIGGIVRYIVEHGWSNKALVVMIGVSVGLCIYQAVTE